MSVAPMHSWEESLAALRADWLTVRGGSSERPAEWEALRGSLSREVADLRSARRWLGGPRTLLQAMRLQYDERRLTAGLGWLLRPDGHHRLGERVLQAFLEALEVPAPRLYPASITREEGRNRTRAEMTFADLVVRVPGKTVLVEAKIWAGEQPEQCARLAAEWRDEDPILVFLTEDGRDDPESASAEDTWKPLSWAQVTDLIDTVVRGLPPDQEPAPGVLDFLETLRNYYGRSTS
jgi:hypothetical protein